MDQKGVDQLAMNEDMHTYSDQELTNVFVAEYQELCKKHGMQLVAMPTWLKRDDNTFSLVIQYQVEKINR